MKEIIFEIYPISLLIQKRIIDTCKKIPDEKEIHQRLEELLWIYKETMKISEERIKEETQND